MEETLTLFKWEFGGRKVKVYVLAQDGSLILEHGLVCTLDETGNSMFEISIVRMNRKIIFGVRTFLMESTGIISRSMVPHDTSPLRRRVLSKGLEA